MLIAWRESFAAFLALGSPACWEPATIQPTLHAIRRLALALLGPPGMVMAAVALAALGTGVSQTGGVNVFVGAIGFKLDRVNPLTNIKNLFSLRATSRLLKSLIPATALAIFAVQRIARQLSIPPFSTERLQILGGDVYTGCGRKHLAGSYSFHLECNSRLPPRSLEKRIPALARRNLFGSVRGIPHSRKGPELCLGFTLGALELSRLDGPPRP
jgi:hypothetical protein